MDYDPLHYPHPSRRSVVYADRGMVATAQPLAAQAGLDILKKGGNAVDAAVAVAACLTVVEPTSNGIGSDAFALVWTGGRLAGLNCSGPAPANLSLDALAASGLKKLPSHGVCPVMVPGAPACWAELVSRYGKLPLIENLRPAIEYARDGFPVSPVVGEQWKAAFDFYRTQQGQEFQPWFDAFAPGGRTPAPGERWRQADQAGTLEQIGRTGARSFYEGELAEKISAFFRRCSGYLVLDDLAAFRPEWVEPVKVDYRGFEVWEVPPNCQGIVALMALNILQGFELRGMDPAEACHLQIEALKLAFADGLEYIADAGRMSVKVEDLLSESYAARRRDLIGDEASSPSPGTPHRGGTVYLAAADGEGNMVSYIQSNFMGFGSGMVVPGTGIALNNRGFCFSNDPAHPNCLEPGKKPYHTIMPGFLTRNGDPVGPFGVMGGFIQPQGHVMVMVNSLDLLLNPQAALDAPRFNWQGGKTVHVEAGFPRRTADALARKGHRVEYAPAQDRNFGRGQIIWRTGEGVLAGGSDPRADGQVAAW